MLSFFTFEQTNGAHLFCISHLVIFRLKQKALCPGKLSYFCY